MTSSHSLLKSYVILQFLKGKGKFHIEHEVRINKQMLSLSLGFTMLY